MIRICECPPTAKRGERCTAKIVRCNAGLAALNAPRERPIVFGGPMIEAILAGRKTQTRRLVKPQPPPPEAVRARAGDGFDVRALGIDGGRFSVVGPVWAVREIMGCEPLWTSPYGRAGDRLWVKETWCLQGPEEPLDAVFGRPTQPGSMQGAWYRATDDGIESDDDRSPWKSPRFMPRWASRITLEVTEVRVQRLQEISEADAQAEGVEPFFARFPETGRDQRLTTGELASDAEHRASFAVLWDEINGDRALWSSNPWVWCISFRRVA